MKTLTQKILHKQFTQHKYVAARWYDGDVTGMNCAICIHQAAKRGHKFDDTPTGIVSFRPISFQEYISTKVRYI